MLEEDRLAKLTKSNEQTEKKKEIVYHAMVCRLKNVQEMSDDN